jgi:hypothetical protein
MNYKVTGKNPQTGALHIVEVNSVSEAISTELGMEENGYTEVTID